MAEEDLVAAGLEVLEELAAVLMEEMHEAAVSRVPAATDQRLARARELRQAGADILVLADACELLILRRTPQPQSGEGRDPEPGAANLS